MTLAGGFLVLGLLALGKDRETAAAVVLGLSAVSLLAGLLVPGRLELLRRGWMKLAEAIGQVTTPVLLALLYYLVVSPAATLRRFRRRRSVSTGSNWHRRAPLPPATRMERQF